MQLLCSDAICVIDSIFDDNYLLVVVEQIIDKVGHNRFVRCVIIIMHHL